MHFALNIAIGLAFAVAGVMALTLGAGALVRTLTQNISLGKGPRFAYILFGLFVAAILPELSVCLYVLFEMNWSAGHDVVSGPAGPSYFDPYVLDTDLLLGVVFGSGIAVLGLAGGCTLLSATKKWKLKLKGVLAIVYVTVFLILALVFYWIQLAAEKPVLHDDFARILFWIFVFFWVIMVFVLGKSDDLETDQAGNSACRPVLPKTVIRHTGRSSGNTLAGGQMVVPTLFVWALFFVASPVLLISTAYLSHQWELDWVKIALLVISGFCAMPEILLGTLLMRQGRIALAATLLLASSLGMLMFCLPFTLWVMLGTDNVLPLELPSLHLLKSMPFQAVRLPVPHLALGFTVLALLVLVLSCVIERRPRPWQGYILLGLWLAWIIVIGWFYEVPDWY